MIVDGQAGLASGDRTPDTGGPAASLGVIDTDVVVLGAGAAGMIAAVSAAEAGAQTVLVEKYEKFAAPGGGVGSINTSDLVDEGQKTDIDEITRQLVLASEGRADPRLFRKWAENSGKTTDWLSAIAKEAGVPTVKLGGQNCYTFGRPSFSGVIGEFYDMLLAYGKRFGLQTWLGTRAIQLVKDEGTRRVVGVEARRQDGARREIQRRAGESCSARATTEATLSWCRSTPPGRADA